MNIRKLIDDQPATAMQLTLIILCFVLNMIDGMDIAVMAYVAPRIIEDWSVTSQAFGLVFSAALIGMAVGAMFISPYTDVIGRRNMLLISVAIVSIGMVLTAFTNNLAQMIALRFFTGLGVGCMLASLTALVSEYSPDRWRNLAVSFMLGGFPVGATLTGMLAAWMIPEFGWRSMFIVGGLLSTVLLPVIIYFLPESLEFLLKKQPRNALEKVNRIFRRMKMDILEALPDQVELTGSHGSGSSAAGNVRSLISPERINATLKLWLAFFMALFSLYFLMSWIPKIAEDAGLTPAQASYAGAFFNFGAFFGIVFLGYISALFGLRRLILIFMLLSAAFMVLFGVFTPPVVLFLLIMLTLGFFVQGGFAGLYSVAARLYPMEIRTTGIGWGIGLGRMGAIVSPALGGLAIGFELPVAVIFALFAVPFILAGLATILIRNENVG